MNARLEILYLILCIKISSQHGIHPLSATTEEIMIINGTRLEVTTVKIAEISNHHYHHFTDRTTFLKAVTARHFAATTTTPKPRVILIPPAHYRAQIRRRLKNAYGNKTFCKFHYLFLLSLSLSLGRNHMIEIIIKRLMKLKVKIMCAIQRISVRKK